MLSPIGAGSEAQRDLDFSDGKAYAGKPRPVVILQDDRFVST